MVGGGSKSWDLNFHLDLFPAGEWQTFAARDKLNSGDASGPSCLLACQLGPWKGKLNKNWRNNNNNNNKAQIQ